MQHIKIYKSDNTYITLPRTRDASMGGELLYKEITVLSGTRKQYVQGYRPTMTYSWEYFPADILAELVEELRKGGFFLVEYPDQSGQDVLGYFSISYPQTRVFKYKNNQPMWCDVSLTFKARDLVEVE